MPAQSLMHRRRVLDKLSHTSALTCTRNTIAVALAEAGKRGDVREYGKIANTPAALRALAAKLASAGAAGSAMRPDLAVIGIQRQLTVAGHGS